MLKIGTRTGGLLAALVVAWTIALSPAPAAIGQSTRCYDDWSDAAPIVQRERLVSARDLQTWARKRLRGKVMRVTLCQDGERFVYRLLIRDPRGRVANRIVDARRLGDGR